MSKKIYVIANPLSGNDATTIDQVEAALREREVDYRMATVSTPKEALKQAQAIPAGSVDALAVFGGDGTVAAVMKGASQSGLPVLILPGGTANWIARDLGLPKDVEGILDLFLEDLYIIRYLNTADVNGSQMLLNVHFGVWSQALQATPRRLKQRLGAYAYYLSGFRHIKAASIRKYRLKIDGREVSEAGFACLISNYADFKILGVRLFVRPRQNGLLQVALFHQIRSWHLLAVFWWRLLGRQDISDLVSTWTAQEVVVLEAPSKMTIDDQAATASLPLRVAISKHKARAIAPLAPPYTSLSGIWRWLVMGRYRLYDDLRRMVTGIPSSRFSQMDRNLYLGGQYSARGLRQLKKWGITGIVSMRIAPPPVVGDGPEILHLPTRDHNAPTLQALQQGVSFIGDHIDRGGSVYIHCRQGMGRGPTMAAAYLVSRGMRTQDAVAHLQRYRPFARPNKHQLQRLAEFEVLCRGEDPVAQGIKGSDNE